MLSFGFKDFISSTSFGTVFNCGQLDMSYGFDIIFVVRSLKNKRLCFSRQPNVAASASSLPLHGFFASASFFSGFQMPF